jgi:hypothetical protein
MHSIVIPLSHPGTEVGSLEVFSHGITGVVSLPNTTTVIINNFRYDNGGVGT